MPNSSLAGLFLVLAGGLAQGAFTIPTKWIRAWSRENHWLLFSFTSYLLAPWLLALLTVPRLFDIYTGSSALVDGILLESVDGRVHLDQFRQAAVCGKPVFIDKPVASTFSDAQEIDRIAKASKVPWFSASSFRFGPAQAMRSPDITGAYVWGPGPLETHQQLDLSWYAIHSIELLFTIMGPDVEQVTRTYTADADVVTGVWKDGRIGVVRTIRPYSTIGAVVFHHNKPPSVYADVDNEYLPLVREIVKFFKTGVLPVSNDETLKIYEFMDAAQQSREHGGIPVNMK